MSTPNQLYRTVLSEDGNKLCPDCKSPNIINDRKHGEVICGACGLVLKERMSDSAESFEEEDATEKAQIYRKKAGLMTEISIYDKDARRRPIPAKRKYEMHRLRRLQRNEIFSDSLERNLSIALPEIDRVCGYLNVPHLREECEALYKQLASAGFSRGRSIESVVGASLYILSRKHNIPLTIEELNEAWGDDRNIKRMIKRNCKYLRKEFNIRPPNMTAIEYIPKFCSKLGVPSEMEYKATEILQSAIETGITSGKKPSAMAAAALYIAGKLTKKKYTQDQIARLIGRTEITIRNHSKYLIEGLSLKC